MFDDMEKRPGKYATPPKWYSEKKKMKAKPYALRYIPCGAVDKNALREFYENQLKDYDEVLSVSQVSEITGYRTTTITSWIRTGRMEALLLLDRYIVPKTLLLDWITSERYNNIERKSKVHVRALWHVCK